MRLRIPTYAVSRRLVCPDCRALIPPPAADKGRIVCPHCEAVLTFVVRVVEVTPLEVKGNG